MNRALLSNFGDDLKIAVVGASGGIGTAFVELLSEQANVGSIFAFSRVVNPSNHTKVKVIPMEISSEESVQSAVADIGNVTTFDIVLVATGILHSAQISPEKSLRDLSMDQFAQVFTINTFGPAIIAKHFLPKLRRDQKSVFACLSARVGSISDNRLGGWYAYRASKSALNMILKTAAIEVSRRNKNACIVGLHPGTVNTNLSEPFQSRVKEGSLFTPHYSGDRLLQVINNLETTDSGKVFAWDGSEVPA